MNLTKQQFQFWMGQQLHQDVPVYNLINTFAINYTLDSNHFQKAFQVLLASTDALRTVITTVEGIPQQIIKPNISYALEIIDFSTDSQPQERFENWLQARTQIVFDLQERLFESALVKLGEDAFVWYLNTHHLISDGWSTGVIFDHMQDLYERASTQSLPEVEAYPAYADFVAQEQHYLDSVQYQTDEAYWEPKLARPIEPLSFYGKMLQRRSSAVKRIPYLLGPERTKQLKAYQKESHFAAKTDNVSLFNIFVTVLAAYLHQMSGNQTISIGMPILNRPQPAFRETVGLCMQVIPLHLTISEDDTFLSLSEQVRSEAQETVRHQRYNVKNYQYKAYDVVFNFHNDSYTSFNGAPLHREFIHTGHGSLSFSLHLRNPETDNFLLQFDFHQDLFTTVQQTTAAEQFLLILDAFLANPQARIGEVVARAIETGQAVPAAQPNMAIPALTVTGRLNGQPVSAFRQTDSLTAPAVPKGDQPHQPDFFTKHPEVTGSSQTTYVPNSYLVPKPGLDKIGPSENDKSLVTHSFKRPKSESSALTIPALFEQQVEKYAQQIALKTRTTIWTYTELNRHANHVAQAILAAAPARHTARVALLFEHDAPMIAALLGTLKTGYTYVPLDVSYPQHRLMAMLEDAQATVIVTNGANMPLAQDLAATHQLINIDTLDFASPIDNIQGTVLPDSIAYILYTSGSTGEPKGVMQSHRNILHFIRVYTNNLHIDSSDKLTLFSSYSFDAAVMDIYGALLNGATLLPINVKAEDLDALPTLMTELGATIYHSTPTVYRYFLNAVPKSDMLPLIRLVVLGGEEVYQKDIELYRTYFSDECVFVNGLGPTESTVTLQNFINKESEIDQNGVPVGYPVEDTEIWLLDENGHNTDQAGEIAIKSAHVALGYWNKPDITAAKFLPDPAGSDKRIYCTGDLGRRLADGRIVFTGRKDFQVKIRGFRIELSEIALALEAHPAVKEAVVVGHDIPDSMGEKRLVAYVVLTADSNLAAQASASPPGDPQLQRALRSFLQRTLPDYMVPSVVMALDALPLTPSGKINRRALPVPDQVLLTGDEDFVGPRDTLELVIASAWHQLLDIPNGMISIYDDFFEIGGHSLLAVQMIARLQKVLDRDIPLPALLEEATIAHLADLVRQEKALDAWSSLVAVQPEGNKPPFFAVHPSGGNPFGYTNLIAALGADQPFYVLQSPALDMDTVPTAHIPNLAKQYIDEIRKVQPQGPYTIGGYCMGGLIAYEMAHHLQAQGEQVSLLALIDPPMAVSPNLQGQVLRWLTRIEKKLSPLEYRLRSYAATFLRLDYAARIRIVGRKSAAITRRLNRKWRRKQPASSALARNSAFSDIKKGPPGRTPYWAELLEANRQAILSYNPRRYSGPLTLFLARKGAVRMRRISWSLLIDSKPEVHVIPGKHTTIMGKNHGPELGHKLQVSLDRVQASTNMLERGPRK